MAISKKRKKILIFTGIGAVLLVLTVVAIARKNEPVITVQTEKVVRTNITEKVVANGRIQPVTQVVISPEVAGEIVALPVEEGNRVKKGDLLVQIKPDNYQASRNSAEANYKSAIANKNLAQAELQKAETEYKRNLELFQDKLVSDSVFLEFKTRHEVAKLQFETAAHQEAQAKFGLDKAIDDLSKTTIVSPLDGTVTRLKSQLGERVLGTSFNMGTEIMTIANLDDMEALVDVGEMDVVLIEPGQHAQLEVDAFKERKFTGSVTEIAKSAKGLGQAGYGGGGGGGGQEATKFEVHIGIKDKENFLPGMSVTADIETRTRTNVLAVPFASVTRRVPKTDPAKAGSAGKTNSVAGATNGVPTNAVAAAASAPGTNTAAEDKKSKDAAKPVDAVFMVKENRVELRPVKIGISDDAHWEVTEGVTEGEEVVSGGYRAISHDLEDGKRITRGAGGSEAEKKKEP